LFITSKGWGTGVPHLVGLNERQQTLITLYRHYVDKGWGTGVPHLVGLSQIIVSVPRLVGLSRIIVSNMYMLKVPGPKQQVDPSN